MAYFISYYSFLYTVDLDRFKLNGTFTNLLINQMIFSFFFVLFLFLLVTFIIIMVVCLFTFFFIYLVLSDATGDLGCFGFILLGLSYLLVIVTFPLSLCFTTRVSHRLHIYIYMIILLIE